MKKNDVLFILLGLLAMSLAFTTTDIYVPALPTIQHFFLVPINQVQYTLSAYLLGLAIAQVTAGPIVDHIGYRKVFLPSIIGFMVTTLICALATNITILIIARTIQALFAGMIGITARASFIRRFSAEQTANIFMSWAPYIILSSVIAPVIGGYIVYYTNWQCIFVFLMLYTGLLLWGAYGYFYVNENKSYPTSLNITIIVKNYLTILQHRPFVQCIFINGIYLGVIFSYLTEAPFIFHAYGYSASNIGLTFIPIALSFLLASQLIRFLRKRFTLSQFVILAYILIIIGLSIMALPAFFALGSSHIIIGISIAVFGMGFSNPVAFGKGMTFFPDMSGAASSLLTAIPFIAGTLLTSLVHPICKAHIGILALFLASITTICVTGYYLLGRQEGTSLLSVKENKL